MTNFLYIVHQCNPPLQLDRSNINSAICLIHLANSSYRLDFPEVLNFQWSLYPISFLPITRPLPLQMKSCRYVSKRLLLQDALKDRKLSCYTLVTMADAEEISVDADVAGRYFHMEKKLKLRQH